ncbi:MAG: hypothetical protein CMJ84_05360 [Planctomycetes bacterium]|jgi:radical SAM superfamily enzyme YgiQ (UPF0313 family)|nr:hypothetical protein [Planctomycetota bacterium]MDP6409581.1 radical SAM protein [Planctomycetota bacterium]
MATKYPESESSETKSILLISPNAKNESLWVTGEDSATCEVLNNFPPLGLATVAGLTPREGYRVQLWDELVHGVITPETVFEHEFDLAAVTGYAMHRKRALELCELFKERGVLTAVGGPGASGEPKAYAGTADVVFVGEVERSWPRFLEEWRAGAVEAEYHQIDKPSLEDSTPPRWESMVEQMAHYGMGAIQTTRGCPYDCEFCDVIYLFGRRQRHKPIEVVIEELREMVSFGFDWVFFCDDEFGGDPKYAKALLRRIIEVNATFEKEIRFSTQMCITAAGDAEFCELLAAANFDMVFVGIESASTSALKGANKLQNLRGDLLTSIHTLLSHGIGIRSGMIVGFDEDDTGIFDTTYEFLQKACLPSVGIYMLSAPLGTRLWMRLMHEGRVLSLAKNKDLGPARALTNIIPKGMTRMELYRGYRDLLERVYSWESFAERICGFLTLAKDSVRHEDGVVAETDAAALVERLGGGSDMLAATRRILTHAAESAPHMLTRARDLVVQHARFFDSIQATLPALDRNIEREEGGEMILEPFQRATPLPRDFKQGLGRILPRVHRRVFVNLDRPERAPRALTDIFVEFLLRVGEGFSGFEDHHTTLIEELCDRTCAEFNGVAAVHFEPASEADLAAAVDLPNVKRTRLVDDLFKSVFQKLSEMRQGA